MSESRPGATRYQRTSGGLIGAMIVTVLFVVAFVAFRGFVRDNDSTPVRTVDYQSWVKSGRGDGKLAVYVPSPLPKGWEATSAAYDTGTQPAWHLGLLTKDRKYVGVEESRDSTRDLVDAHVDPEATRGKDVRVDGVTWQTWRDPGGDYALVRRLDGPDGTPESVLLVGSAPEAQIRDVAASLSDG
jgi:hypothetical protein